LQSSKTAQSQYVGYLLLRPQFSVLPNRGGA
jgi:hypothetical protein